MLTNTEFTVIARALTGATIRPSRRRLKSSAALMENHLADTYLFLLTARCELAVWMDPRQHLTSETVAAIQQLPT